MRLLAQGLTDARIAEQLVISHRTVNNQLTSIYSKIQVSSRSAATRYAIEHQLADRSAVLFPLNHLRYST